MQLFNRVPTVDFVGKRKVAMFASLALIVVCVGSIAVRGLEFGIDFTGGTLLELGYPESVELAEVRVTLAEGGFAQAVVQQFNTRDILVRLQQRDGVSNAQLSSKALQLLRQASGDPLDVRRVEFVGPQVGEELREDGGLAMLIALGAILIYVGFRFEIRFALGSVAALVHDVILTIGFFSLLGLDFDLTVLAAVLAVIGYSLNDTIVVFDRVRENFRKMRRGSAEEIVNRSLNETLSRTLMTSVTTLLVLVALFTLGGELIHGFATALMVGVVVGTYSSIYIASSAVLALGITKQDLMPMKKEGANEGATP